MAEYQMQEMPIPNEEGKKILFPRMRIWEQRDLDYLVRNISYASTFTPGDIEGLVRSITLAIAHELGTGHSVKIDGLGVFTPSLGLNKGVGREEADGQKRNALSVCVKNINFRADKELICRTAENCELVRSKFKFRRSSQKYTPEERLKLAQDYLEQHPFMKINDYCRLTGLLRNAAANELKQWATTEGTGIRSTGYRTHKVYVKG